ncbi:MAG: UDP-N-acetylglucosamine 2-epimerase (non-hydrolyzing) [Sporomusaceae bacterium]|nr:UDP-N-acetylglucosamine 2-epimerase (non-hydrolyzing) [Sporomusaceae bacterium]
MKIATVVGARPQFVKASVVSKAIEEYNSSCSGSPIEEILINTGQHYDSNMSAVFFDEMRIPKPGYSLGIGGGLQGAMTGRMIEKLENIMLQLKPDVVLVYGDTNSTLAGALAAVKLHIPVAHVEAGLRSFNMNMPEEINRILTDRISQWLFCPTATAVENLKREGFIMSHHSGNGNNNPRLTLIGDVMYDAALYYRTMAVASPTVDSLIRQLGRKHFYLATVHRAENTDDSDALGDIFRALNTIARKTPVILPLHPRTKKLINCQRINIQNITLIDPVGYFDMIMLLENCLGVFTDSGGLQKEAYFFLKPCITLRQETEWIELVNNGCNILAGADYESIINAERNMGEMAVKHDEAFFGDGHAGAKIVRYLAME